MTNDTKITIVKSKVLTNAVGEGFIKVFILNKNYVQNSLKELIKSILQENYKITKQKHESLNQIRSIINGEYYISGGQFDYKITIESI